MCNFMSHFQRASLQFCCSRTWFWVFRFILFRPSVDFVIYLPILYLWHVKNCRMWILFIYFCAWPPSLVPILLYQALFHDWYVPLSANSDVCTLTRPSSSDVIVGLPFVSWVDMWSFFRMWVCIYGTDTSTLFTFK